LNFNNPDDFSSSPCSKASADENEDENQAFREGGQKNDDSNSDDSDLSESESTVTGVTAGDLTARSHGDSSTGSSGRLEEALRLAARQAGTQGIEYDENGDITMELADDEITSAFQPWMGGGKQVPLPEQENVNPFSPAFSANMTQAAAPDEADKTMEFTQSVGTILADANKNQSSNDYLQVAGGSARRLSAGGHYRSSGDSSVFGDETMDLTTAIGTIQQNQQAPSVLQPTQDWDSGDEDEELTMDFTSAVGGLLGQFSAAQEAKVTMVNRQPPGENSLEEGNSVGSKRSLCSQEGMITTIAAGDVQTSVAQPTELPGDQTIEMDMTTAIGAILSQELSHCNQAKDMSLVERKTETEHPICSASDDDLPASFKPSAHVATMTSETGSPSLMSFQRRVSAKKTVHQRHSITPKPASMQCTPTKKLISTPSLLGHTTPSKTSPSRNIIKKNASPKKLVKPQTPQRSPAQLQTQAAQLFTKDSHSGEATPSIVLNPPFRRSSGMGVDKPGLGSPRVTALLERRRSIGDDAKTFILQNEAAKSVTFENPQLIKDDLETQDAADDRMSERGVLQTDIHHPKFGDEKDTTANLKDLIESLTPRKKKLNGRKSLHVGAAKGLLGKRPVELDEDEDEDSTPKRLKGRDGSPVKKIRLPAPPTKNETTGRITRSARRSFEEICDNKTMRTPTQLGKAFGIQSSKEDMVKDIDNLSNLKMFPEASNEKAPSQEPNAVGSSEVFDRVHLQDFLDMTNIRFMELTTTKRRLTVAPNLVSEKATNNQSAGMGDVGVLERKGSELEQCVVAGACTIPMLELYQHVSPAKQISICQ
jgi:kinetochore protein Spc7/SPC105